jgi:hypothetical protein
MTNGDSVVLYQPQVSSWNNQEQMVGLAAVSYQAKGSTEPVLGTIRIESKTQVSVADRLVNFSPFTITEFNFPTLSKEQSSAIIAQMRQTIPVAVRVISLDRVLASINKSTIIPKSAESTGIKADPPKIFHSTTPAILLMFDGQPIWSPIEKNDLKYAVNTNWDIFQSTSTKVYYLRNDKSWLTTTDLNEPWKPATHLPSSLKDLPANDNWKETLASLSGEHVTHAAAPKVFTSYEPAELIYLTGAPQYVPVAGNSLLWVSNTEADLFRDGSHGPFYYLVAGRWFRSSSLDGPWTFATPTLPLAFKNIPVDHPRSRVLASVPGTDQAAEAVLLAQVPQTARVNVKEIKAPEVNYQGGPEFKPIEGTSLERAVNTDKDIIKYGDTYYFCIQGVWFMSHSASGPWEVTTNIPDEIYKIPASSPAYEVTYVKAKKDEDTTDDWATFESEAGYTGTMVAWGCAVWGTGWYYPPYYWYGGYYPIYYWYPPTYGLAAWYNPYTGTFGRGAFVYGPYGGAGVWGAYNPRTGTYARGGSIYGPYGSRSFAQAWNPRTGTYAATRQGSNVYGNWGSSVVKRGDNWVQTGHINNAGKGTTTRGARNSEGAGVITRKGPDGRTTIGKGSNGDVYAGRDGNIYRKQDGNWQHWENGAWSQVEKPEPNKVNPQNRKQNPQNGTARPGNSVIDDLNKDYKARQEGEKRTRNNQTYRSTGGGRNSAGSFGRMGGGRMGGGRRR